MGRAPRGAMSEVGHALATPKVMARSIGALYTAGAMLAFAWVALHHGTGDPVVATMAALAFTGGLALLTGVADELDPRWFHVVIAAVQLVITVGYAAGGSPDNDLRMFFIWATPFACFFFLPRHAALHLVWVGLLLGIGLEVQGATSAEAIRIWSMTYGTLLAVGALVLSAAAGVRHREEALRRAASYDPLTGLANRALFARRCDQALARRRSDGGQVLVLLADLDRFKAVNDTHGHLAGDRLLEALADALDRVAPPGSLVARMGGDEFAILVDDPSGMLDARAVTDDVSAAMSRVIDIGRSVVHTTASIGAALAADDDTPTSLLRDADLAMYRAKRSTTGGVCMRDLVQCEEDQRNYLIEQALHDAIGLEQFHLVYQPVVDLHTGRTRSAEVLLRWTHPELGEISPAEFIPVAEETGMIREIGAWVLARAIEQLGRWCRDGVVDDEFRLSVNVSGHQLRTVLPDTVARLLAEHDVAPQRLMIELTETVIISAHAETSDTLGELQAMGVRLVLDDFGTGFSSLSHLQRIRFDAVKIDRSFVGGVVEPGTDRSIIAAIIALGEALGIDVVAEGVETRDQADALRSLGCPLGQGFLFDRPLRADALCRRVLGVAADSRHGVRAGTG